MRFNHNERAWCYVTQRGARTWPVFDLAERRDAFLRALEGARMEVHGYAVLPWRYHLLVRATAPELLHGLRRLMEAFTAWFNGSTGLRGPVLSAQCDRVVLDEAEAAQVLAEIHYLPVAALVVDESGHYDWSSYPSYIGTVPLQPWLTIARLHPYVQQPDSIRSTVPPPLDPVPAAFDEPFDDAPLPDLDLDLVGADYTPR